jgi:hypothetical protein
VHESRINVTNEECKQSSLATRHGGVWGERRYSSYSFFTSALDGDEWSASRSEMKSVLS